VADVVSIMQGGVICGIVQQKITTQFISLGANRVTRKVTLEDVLIFSTFFYSKLTEEGPESVKRWTRGRSVFEQKLIFIPGERRKTSRWVVATRFPISNLSHQYSAAS